MKLKNSLFFFFLLFSILEGFSQKWEKVGTGFKSRFLNLSKISEFAHSSYFSPTCSESFQANLFIGGANLNPLNGNCELAKWDGSSWTYYDSEINQLGFTGPVTSMLVYNGALYISKISKNDQNNSYGIIKFDGNNFSLMAHFSPEQLGVIDAMAEYNGSLYFAMNYQKKIKPIDFPDSITTEVFKLNNSTMVSTNLNAIGHILSLKIYQNELWASGHFDKVNNKPTNTGFVKLVDNNWTTSITNTLEPIINTPTYSFDLEIYENLLFANPLHEKSLPHYLFDNLAFFNGNAWTPILTEHSEVYYDFEKFTIGNRNVLLNVGYTTFPKTMGLVNYLNGVFIPINPLDTIQGYVRYAKVINNDLYIIGLFDKIGKEKGFNNIAKLNLNALNFDASIFEAIDDYREVLEDNTICIDVQKNDRSSLNINSNPKTRIIQNAKKGKIELMHQDSLWYTPYLNVNGLDSFTYSICNSQNQCDTATVRINIIPVNDRPICNVDRVTASIDRWEFYLPRENDLNPDGDSLQMKIIANESAVNGKIELFDQNRIAYLTDPDPLHIDSFFYVLCDSTNLCDTSYVLIDIMNGFIPVKAKDLTIYTAEDISKRFELKYTAYNRNDLFFSILDKPKHGSFIIEDYDQCTYVPLNNYFGLDTSSFIVCDSKNYCDTASIFYTITSRDDICTAVNDTFKIEKNKSSFLDVLKNDYDLEGETFSFNEIYKLPTNGTATVYKQEIILYQPKDNFEGTDYLEYSIMDSKNSMAWAQVFIFVGNKNSIGMDNKFHSNAILDIFPNPNNGFFTIQNKNNSPLYLEVYNILNQKIYSKSISAKSKESLDLTNHPNGLYTLLLKDDNQLVLVKKFEILK